MSQPPYMPEIPELPMIGACRKRVGHTHGGDLLLLIILRTGLILKLYPKPAIPWVFLSRRYFMEQLGISAGMYTDGIKALRDKSGLIEWKHRGGRAAAGFQLSPEGTVWARSEGLLPEQAGGV